MVAAVSIVLRQLLPLTDSDDLREFPQHADNLGGVALVSYKRSEKIKTYICKYCRKFKVRTFKFKGKIFVLKV